MSLHNTTGRYALGLGLAVFTSFLWGILPIVLKEVLKVMDAYTITWYRFIAAGILLLPFVLKKHGRPSFAEINGMAPWLIIIATGGLCGNYILYLIGLNHLTPSTAVVVVQLAPIFLMIGGLIVFKESYSPRQFFGFALVILGFGLFFNRHIAELISNLGSYTIGVLLVVASAFIWAAYALAQKQLLKYFPSEIIMLLIYAGGAVLFLPVAGPAQVMRMNSFNLGLLLFCALNTLIAYGCFAEALDHIEASRVSAVIAMTPLFTIAGMKIMQAVFPGSVTPENLNNMSIIGAVFVVGGSMITSLSQTAPEM